MWKRMGFNLILIAILVLQVVPLAFGATNEKVEVEVDILNVRSGPGLDYPVVGKIYFGESYSILEKNNDWLKINYNNTSGWITSWYVHIVKQEEEEIKTAESKINNLNVRKGPSTTFTTIEQIHPETRYKIIDQDGDWVKIQLNPDKSGWVATWLITISDEKPSQQTLQKDYVTIQVDYLNVRSGPSTEYERLGFLHKGDKVEVLKIEDGWYEIVFEAGTGWITSAFAAQEIEDQESNLSPTEASSQKKVIVNIDGLNFRSSPAVDNNILKELPKNEVLTVLEKKNEWFKVSRDNSPSEIGWVANWLVVDYNRFLSNQPTVNILNPGTNLREGPSTSFSVVTIVNTGDQFPIIGTKGDWYQVLLADGRKAYVAGWIVSTKGMEQNLNVGIERLLKNKVIVIDPGHGGNDIGATGLHFRSIEKDLNLLVAKKLQKKLEAAGAKVVMTRTNDIKIPLQGRVDTAVYKNADAFVSIHHNTNDNTIINGTITYYYNNKGKALANEIQNELVKKIKTENLNIRYGDYFVLRQNPQLSVLIELAFISNYQDELRARSEVFKENAAEGIFQGLIKYFDKQ